MSQKRHCKLQAVNELPENQQYCSSSMPHCSHQDASPSPPSPSEDMESTLAALDAVVCQPVDRIVQHEWGKVRSEMPTVRYKIQVPPCCKLFKSLQARPPSQLTIPFRQALATSKIRSHVRETALPRATRCPSVEKLRRECSWMCAAKRKQCVG